MASGYLADLVVLSADPFASADLGPEAVEATVVGGRPAHAAGGLSGWAASEPSAAAAGMAPATAGRFSVAAG